MRYALAGEPNTFNYLAASESRSRLLVMLTTGTLLEFDPVAQTVGPGVCDAIFGSDGTSARLALRQGLRFSDGVLVGPEDVVFTLENILDPASSNVLKDSAYIYGEPLKFSVLPSGEIELRWPRPFSGIESVLSTIPVLPRHLLESEEGDSPIEEKWTLGTDPVEMAGLGPFMVAEHKPGIGTTLKRNPYYWKTDSSGAQLPYLDEVRLLYLEDRNAQVLRLNLGQLDLIDQLLRPEDFRLLEERKVCVTRELGPSSNVTFFCLNLNQPTKEDARIRYSWFSKRGFRRALSAAVSRSSIVRNVYLGLATEAKRLISPANSRWYLPAEAEKSGLEVAHELLRQAGFSFHGIEGGIRLVDSAGNPVRFELVTSAGDVQGRIASLIRQDLARVGIEVSVRQEELRSVISRVMGSHDFDVAIMNLDLPLEPFQMRDLLLSDGAMHVWRLDRSEAPEWELEDRPGDGRAQRYRRSRAPGGAVLPRAAVAGGGSSPDPARPSRHSAGAESGAEQHRRGIGVSLCVGAVLEDLKGGAVKSILRFVLRRLLEAIPALFLLSVLVFVFFSSVPGDFLTEMELNPTISKATVEKLREDFGLRKALPAQYLAWLSQVVRGNFGYSFAQHRPAFQLVIERLKFTLFLAGVALLFSLSWSVPLACVSAALIGGLLDRVILVLSLVALSLPSVLSAVLLFGISIWSGWSPFLDSEHIYQVWLPALTLAIPSGAVFLRILRLELVDVLSQPYIASAAARGIPRHRILFQALRNAANPLISMAGVTLAGLMSGAVVAEKVFGWPGLGALTVDAIQSRDLYVALFAVLTAAVAVLCAGLIADIVLCLNDPRVREP